MKKIIFFFLFCILTSCGSNYINYNKNSEAKNLTGENPKKKLLHFSSGTFQVYYRDNSTIDSNDSLNYEKQESIYASQLKKFADYQYLIKRNDTIIYISTTPSPVETGYRNYFFRHPDPLNMSTPNVYYFYTFLIGRQENSTIVFRDDKKKMHWNLSEENNKIKINSIDTYRKKYKNSRPNYIATISPKESIDIGFVFKEIKNFRNFFYSNDANNKDFNENLPEVDEFILEYDEQNKLTRIILLFKTEVSNGYNSVEYRKSRVKYSKLE